MKCLVNSLSRYFDDGFKWDFFYRFRALPVDQICPEQESLIEPNSDQTESQVDEPL